MGELVPLTASKKGSKTVAVTFIDPVRALADDPDAPLESNVCILCSKRGFCIVLAGEFTCCECITAERARQAAARVVPIVGEGGDNNDGTDEEDWGDDV